MTQTEQSNHHCATGKLPWFFKTMGLTILRFGNDAHNRPCRWDYFYIWNKRMIQKPAPAPAPAPAPSPALGLADELLALAEKATPPPWYAGPVSENDDGQRYVSVGPYSLADRPGRDHHYEDTILEVWSNPNLCDDEGEEATATAALIVALINNLPAILTALRQPDAVDALREARNISYQFQNLAAFLAATLRNIADGRVNPVETAKTALNAKMAAKNAVKATLRQPDDAILGDNLNG